MRNLYMRAVKFANSYRLWNLLKIIVLLPVNFVHADNTVVVVPLAGETVMPSAASPVVRDTPPLGNYLIEGERVMDRATGLVWQRRRSSGTMTWKEAIDYCAVLQTAGGYNRWQLPTIEELITLFRFGRNPMIDTTVFRSGDADHWSSSYSAKDIIAGSYTSNSRWVADFSGLHIEGPIGRSSLQSVHDRHYARCVHGPKR